MPRILFTLLTLIVALMAALYTSPPTSEADNPRPGTLERTSVEEAAADVVPGQITVRFKEGVPNRTAGALTGALGLRQRYHRSRSGLRAFELPPGASQELVLATLRASPLVAEAGVSRIAHILDTPDDPSFPYQWHMRSNNEGGIWGDVAWDLAPNRGLGVTVAIIDTGVAYEDYNGQLGTYPQTFKRAPDFATTQFVLPYDFANDDAHANDDHGHGSHVAGTIAQSTNNALGMAGTARNAAIMPLKAMDYAGNGNDYDIVEAIHYAVDNGADVINMSLGWPGSGSPDANGDVCTEIVGMNAALDYADAHGVTVVAAAGNDGGGTVLCPAAHPTVIAVGATRFDAGVTFYSNHGAALDITAPGGDPTIDQSGDGYVDGVLQQSFCYDAIILLLINAYGTFCNVYNSGTSMASPHVAGTAALLLGEDASLSPDQVRSLMQSTARDKGAAGWDQDYGWGVLDAAGALASLKGVPKPPAINPPGLNAPTNLTAVAVSSSRINVAWTDNATAETGYKLERSNDGQIYTQIAILPANTISYANTNLAAGTTFYYRARAYKTPDHSAYSNVAIAATQPGPAAPSNLTATAVSSSRINLAWTDNATNETGFKVERSTDGVNFTQIAILLANTTSYPNSSLAASTSFTYRVRSYDGPNHSAYSNPSTATTFPPPAAPSNLAATAVSSSQINLTWKDNSTYEAGFKLERSSDNVSFAQIGTLLANATAYSNSALAPGTLYYYRVRAYDTPNDSAYSNTASATTKPLPAAPSNLVATAVSSSRINLAWTDNANNESGFKLERGTDGATYTQIATLAANTTSYSNTSLIANTTYYYRVRAYEGANNSSYSNVASATTQGAVAAPTNLTATAVSSSRINLAWTDNATTEAGFKLERSSDGVNFAQIALLLANTTSYANTNLPAATTYHYRVRAYDGPNDSVYSNVATQTTLALSSAPSNLVANALSKTRIALTWTDNATNEGGFRLERSTDGVNFTQVGIFGPNTTSYTNNGLTSGATYHYRVLAYEGPNNSAWSNVATATTP